MPRKPTPFPGFVEPARPDLKKVAPSGDRWIHEVKFDGYRMQLHIQDGRVRIYTRNAYDWTDPLPTIVAAAQALKIQSAIIDGEMTAGAKPGGNFNAMQNWRVNRRGDLRFHAFDLLYRDGEDLRPLPLIKRKEALDRLLRGAPPEFQFVEWVEDTEGPRVYEGACALGLEGIVSKLKDAPYIIQGP